MHENPSVVFALASILVPILVDAVDAVDAGEAYWSARHDPTWETRWRTLDPAERSWLAVMATSRNWMATLTDPEEIRPAKGRRSQESRRRISSPGKPPPRSEGPGGSRPSPSRADL